MRKFNRLRYRKYKQEKLSQHKEENKKFKKALKKTLYNIASMMLGLELAADNFEDYPRGLINFLDDRR